MKKQFILHPFMFAAYPVLFLYSCNVGQVSFSEIVMPLFIAVSITFLLLIILKSIIGNWLKAGIISSIYLILFFSYGHILNVFPWGQIGPFVMGRHKILLFIWIILSFCSTVYVIRTERLMKNTTFYLNVLSLILVLVSLVSIGIYESRIGMIWQMTERDQKTKVPFMALDRIEKYPDIYYIILDGYMSERNLRKYYNYDNMPFIRYLKRKCFYIASKSNSNYAITNLSLAASLNMRYLNHPSDQIVFNKLLENNLVMKYLRSNGYKIIYFNYGFQGNGQHIANFDWDILCGQWNGFSMLLFKTTILDVLGMKLKIYDHCARQRTLFMFSTLPGISQNIPGPRFIFAHFLFPHPPFLFGPNGKYVPDPVSVKERRRGYVGQIKYANVKMVSVINELLKDVANPPIIVLQGDHGAGYDMEIDTKSKQIVEKQRMQEKMGILNAYYLPSGGQKMLYESISPVNSFRLIFNYYFKTDYDMLIDKAYYNSFDVSSLVK